MRLFLFVLLICAASAIGNAGALAQSPPLTPADLQRNLSKIEALIEEFASDDEKLVLQKIELDKLSKSLIDYGVSFRPQLSTINKRLAELGPPPKENETADAAMVSAERQALLARKLAINGELGAAEQLSIRTSQASNKVSDYRREIFANTLLRRTQSTGVFSAGNWRSFQGETTKAWRSVTSRIKFVWQFRKGSILYACGLSLLVAAGIFIATRRSFGRLLFTRNKPEALDYFSRLSIAFWSIVVPSLAASAILACIYALFLQFSVFTGQSLQMFRALLVSLAALVFVFSLVNAVFSPNNPQRRLGPFTGRAARWLVVLTTAMATVHILDFFLGWLNDIFSSPLSVTVAQSMVAALLIGLLLILIALLKPLRSGPGEPAAPWPALMRVPMLLLAGFVIAAAVSGYVGLARFTAGQIVITGAILATMLIGIQSGRALGADGALDVSPFGKWLQKRFELGETALDQLGLLLSMAVYLLVVLIGLPLIALQWGFNWVDVSTFLYRAFTNITIGSMSISLFAILFGIVLFVLGYILTRQFQIWLDRTVMARSRIDTGVRNSIRTVTGYLGIALAALIGISSAGFDLSNLAIVAGALSLGIGFGLQNIVNNFVSGLILLAERPFKVGDWIVAGQTAGTVKRISVRATEIETFQKQTVILPNSELINQPVGNWTHRNHLGRVDVAASVAYGTNPRMVHDLLLEIAQADPSVLKVPEPFVVFLGFGESALNFDLRFHVKDVLEGSVIATRIRFAIVDAFEQRAIQIPFPQRDLNIKSEDLEFLITRLQAAAKPAKTVTRARKKPAAR